MRKNYTPTKDKFIRYSPPFTPQTDEQWQGNEPYWIDKSYHALAVINPNTNEPIPLNRWVCRYGSGWTYTNPVTGLTEFPCFEFNLEDSVHIHLITPLGSEETTLFIDRLISNSSYKYQSDKNQFSKVKATQRDNFQDLNQDEYEHIQYILNTKIDNCKIWDMFQAKCLEIFNNLNKGKFIDYENY